MIARGADRKTEILDAAMARIVGQGVEGLRVRDVAQDVGINNATLHHHYPTKAAMVEALVQRFLDGFSVLGGVPDGGQLDDRLATYVDVRRSQMLSAPDTFLVLGELMVLARRDQAVRSLMAQLQDHWRDYLAGVCRNTGLNDAAALSRADRCRHELLGMCLDLCVTRVD